MANSKHASKILINSSYMYMLNIINNDSKIIIQQNNKFVTDCLQKFGVVLKFMLKGK